MLSALRRTLTYTVLILWFIAVAMPLVWVVTNSFRSSQEIFRNPFGAPWLITGSPYADDPSIPSPWQGVINNYQSAWVKSHFSSYFLNSVLVTSLSLLGILAVSAMAAYALARFEFRGNRAMLLYFLSGLMVPAQLVLVPLFFEFTYLSRAGSWLLRPFGYELQLHDSFFGLITIYIALSLPFTILILTGFFKSLPGALREAGIMDGCSEYGVFWFIMLPLSRPGLVTRRRSSTSWASGTSTYSRWCSSTRPVRRHSRLAWPASACRPSTRRTGG